MKLLNRTTSAIFALATFAIGSNLANAADTKPFTGVCHGTRSSRTTIDGFVSVTLDALKGDTSGHRKIGNNPCIVKDWDLTLFCPNPKNVCRAIGVMHYVPQYDHYEMTKTLDVMDLGEDK